MQINSINTNISAYYAQTNIRIASSNTSKSVARLSSGNRIVSAADDVAALSIGTSLATNVRTLRTALINTSQASSLLQVADGALAQVTEILQRQKAIAVQAGSGSLSSAERSFLNAEFTNLTDEIDRLVDNTNFNGVKLLDGSLFDRVSLTSKETAAAEMLGSITFQQNTANVASGNIILNGVTVIVGTDSTVYDVARGSTLEDTLDNLVNYLNSSTNTSLSGAIYSRSGNTLEVAQRAGGVLGGRFTIEKSMERSTAFTDTGTFSATSNSIVNVSGFSSGYAYQQIWGFSVANLTADIVTGAAGGFGAGGFSVKQDDGTAFVVHSLVAGDSLTTLINKINEDSATTGVTARLIGASTYYGVQLETSTQRDIGATFTEAASTHLIQTRTTGALQLRSASLTAANVRTTVVTGAGEAHFSIGNFTINGTAGAGESVVAGDDFLDVIEAIEAANSSVAATLEWDSAAPGQYYMVVSSNVLDKIEVAASGAMLASSQANLDANSASQLVDLQGGNNNGLRMGATIASGTMGDSILSTLSNSRSQVKLSFTDLTDSAQLANLAGRAIRFDVGDGLAGQQLAFLLTDTSSFTPSTFDDNIVSIGASLEDTLDNIVKAINNYANNGEVDAFTIKQLEARREGLEIIVEYQGIGDLYARGSTSTALKMYTNIAQTDATLSSSTTVTGTGLDGGNTNQVTSFNSGAADGVDTTGVINEAFVGSVGGFEAEYNGTSNRVTLSITVGEHTYTATNVDTAVATDTTVRLRSVSGGYFDLKFEADQGTEVSSQEDAQIYADRLEQAFSSLVFSQNRVVASYNPAGDIITNSAITGSLTGTTVELQLSDFEDVSIDDISVTAPPEGSTNGIIEFTINGETYRNAEKNIGSSLASRGVYYFESITSPNNRLKFKVGDTAIEFDTSDKAANFEAALKKAFGIGVEGVGQSLKFQVGVTVQDTLSVRIDKVTTGTLYGGLDLDVLTQENAATAADTIDAAIKVVTEVRANVGALSSRFNFAAANIESSIQNQDAARGTLLDTDIADESTSYATNQVKLQAGISVLAQSNQQLQSLLKLIG